jgi:hypothetical protein
MRMVCFICGSLLVLFSGEVRADFVILDVPGSLSTAATGISEGVVAGTYVTTSPVTGLLTTKGFLYQNGTYYGYIVPGSTSTDIARIYGRTIVGGYQDSSWLTHGFLLNGQTLTTLDFPGSKVTMVTGISGSTTAGWYLDAQGKLNGFVYRA